MRITRHADAVPYAAPLHTGVDTRRLQGLEAGPSENFWVGLSVYPPGGIAAEGRQCRKRVSALGSRQSAVTGAGT